MPFSSVYGNIISAYTKNGFMKKQAINRNRTADKGSNNDPDLRDRSGQQPSASTYSETKDDNDNQEITRTSADNYEEGNFAEDADKTFDQNEDE